MTRIRQLLAVAAILSVNDAWILGVGGTGVMGASHGSRLRSAQSVPSSSRSQACGDYSCRFAELSTPTPTVLPTPAPIPAPVPTPTATSGRYLPNGDGW